MENNQIIEAVNSVFGAENILEITPNISPINEQIDDLTIIFHPDFSSLAQIGELMDNIETIVMDDEYGDIVEFDIKYSRYHELKNGDLTASLIITFTIDS